MITSRARPDRRGGFTLVELIIAASVSGFILAGVLTTSLHMARSGARLANYGEMEGQSRRALEQFGNEARLATDLVLNNTGDLTFSIPDAAGTTSSVTYAWTAASQSFFRVPGAASSATAQRRVLVTGIPTPADGTTGVLFERLDRTGTACSTDAATKLVRISFALSRQSTTTVATAQRATAVFVLRNKTAP